MGRIGITQNQVKSKLIEKTVREYFQSYPLETYVGRVSVREVLDMTKMTITDFNLAFTPFNEGEVYDAIREHGPVGEHDTQWLREWGQSRITWTANEQGDLEPLIGASIDNWGRIV